MSQKNLPLPRHSDLIVEPVGDELIVYDNRADKAYLLNPPAKAVWQACNGKRTIPEIAAHVSREAPAHEQAVWYALGQFNELLEEPVELPRWMVGVTRRGFLKMSGAVAAGVAIPLVVKMAAPSPVQAASLVCCQCVEGNSFFANACSDCSTRCDSTFDCPAEPFRCTP